MFCITEFMEVLHPSELLTEESGDVKVDIILYTGSKPSKLSKLFYCFFLFQMKFIVPMPANSNCRRPFILVADKLFMRRQPRQ